MPWKICRLPVINIHEPLCATHEQGGDLQCTVAPADSSKTSQNDNQGSERIVFFDIDVTVSSLSAHHTLSLYRDGRHKLCCELNTSVSAKPDKGRGPVRAV